MLTKIMKWVSIAVLLLALLWRSSASYQILLEFVVCAGAVLVVRQAWLRGKYLWGIGFIAIALLFNPIAPVVLPRQILLGLNLVCLAGFLVSLALLNRQRQLPEPLSIWSSPSGSIARWTNDV